MHIIRVDFKAVSYIASSDLEQEIVRLAPSLSQNGVGLSCPLKPAKGKVPVTLKFKPDTAPLQITAFLTLLEEIEGVTIEKVNLNGKDVSLIDLGFWLGTSFGRR